MSIATATTASCLSRIALVLLCFSAAITTAATLSLPLKQPGSAGLHKAQSVGSDKALLKIDPMLARAAGEYKAHSHASPGTPFAPSNSYLRVAAGRVLVDAVATDDAHQLLTDLKRLGLQQGSQYGAMVSGRLPLGAISRAGGLNSLRYLSASIPMTRTGLVTSQGDLAMAAGQARLDNGLSGSGVTVGILSDSYDQQGGAAADIASGDLPAGTTILDDGGICQGGTGVVPCSDEGRAMAQIVHDVAPGADLSFHTAFNGIADFAQGIRQLADAGADVIVDDVFYLNEPIYQDGAIAQAIDDVVADGVAFFSAAGNSGRDSYESPFDGSGDILYLEYLPGFFITIGEMHDFNPAPGPGNVDTLQQITIPSGQCMLLMVQWDSPFGSAALGTGTLNDLDIFLANAAGTEMVTWDGHENIPAGEPYEAMQWCNDGLLYPEQPYYNLVIALWDGAPPGLWKFVIFGAGSIDEYATHSGTVFGHANAAGAEAVGAAYYAETPAFGQNPPLLESFSSAGGVPILLAENGDRLPSPDYRSKPGIIAPDGVDTTFFYPYSNRDGNDFPDFSGTSAAAPHAAAVAALMLESEPNALPSDIYSAMRATALDMGAAGFDYDTGFGLLQAPGAIAVLEPSGTPNQPPVASFSFVTSGLDVSFTDTSSDTDGDVVSWAWDFGDGVSSGSANPSHSYSTDGSYTVTLTVTDNDSAAHASSQDVAVSDGAANTPPNAYFSYSCTALACNFTDRSSDPDDGDAITLRAWSFGDGAVSSATDPSHSFSSQGRYTVTLVVTDQSGEEHSASASFRVKNRGSASGTGGAPAGDGGGGEDPVLEAERGRKKCNDGLDNDGDTLIDSADPDC